MSTAGPDLTVCETEPIHIPSAVESNGAILVLSEPAMTILQSSTNALEILGLAGEALHGMALEELFASEDVLRLVSVEVGIGKRHFVQQLRASRGEVDVDALVHRHQGLLIIEFEPSLGRANSRQTSVFLPWSPIPWPS